jgi:hypothetical protein
MAVLTTASQVAARFDKLALGVGEVPVHAVKLGTDHAHEVVVASGARFKIRGRGHNAKRWPLVARAKFEPEPAMDPMGTVSAAPKGFWSIVEQGRRAPKGSYIIRASGGSTSKGSALTSSRRRFGKAAVNRTGSFAGATPMPLGGGQFSYVVRPGPHRPLGHPWAEATSSLDRTIGPVMGRAAHAALVASIGEAV